MGPDVETPPMRSGRLGEIGIARLPKGAWDWIKGSCYVIGAGAFSHFSRGGEVGGARREGERQPRMILAGRE